MSSNPLHPTTELHKATAAKGGSARTEAKSKSSRANLALARERKLLYRLNPSLRKETTNGHQV